MKKLLTLMLLTSALLAMPHTAYAGSKKTSESNYSTTQSYQQDDTIRISTFTTFDNDTVKITGFYKDENNHWVTDYFTDSVELNIESIYNSDSVTEHITSAPFTTEALRLKIEPYNVAGGEKTVWYAHWKDSGAIILHFDATNPNNPDNPNNFSSTEVDLLFSTGVSIPLASVRRDTLIEAIVEAVCVEKNETINGNTYTIPTTAYGEETWATTTVDDQLGGVRNSIIQKKFKCDSGTFKEKTDDDPEDRDRFVRYSCDSGYELGMDIAVKKFTADLTGSTNNELAIAGWDDCYSDLFVDNTFTSVSNAATNSCDNRPDYYVVAGFAGQPKQKYCYPANYRDTQNQFHENLTYATCNIHNTTNGLIGAATKDQDRDTWCITQNKAYKAIVTTEVTGNLGGYFFPQDYEDDIKDNILNIFNNCTQQASDIACKYLLQNTCQETGETYSWTNGSGASCGNLIWNSGNKEWEQGCSFVVDGLTVILDGTAPTEPNPTTYTFSNGKYFSFGIANHNVSTNASATKFFTTDSSTDDNCIDNRQILYCDSGTIKKKTPAGGGIGGDDSLFLKRSNPNDFFLKNTASWNEKCVDLKKHFYCKIDETTGTTSKFYEHDDSSVGGTSLLPSCTQNADCGLTVGEADGDIKTFYTSPSIPFANASPNSSGAGADSCNGDTDNYDIETSYKKDFICQNGAWVVKEGAPDFITNTDKKLTFVPRSLSVPKHYLLGSTVPTKWSKSCEVDAPISCLDGTLHGVKKIFKTKAKFGTCGVIDPAITGQSSVELICKNGVMKNTVDNITYNLIGGTVWEAESNAGGDTYYESCINKAPLDCNNPSGSSTPTTAHNTTSTFYTTENAPVCSDVEEEFRCWNGSWYSSTDLPLFTVPNPLTATLPVIDKTPLVAGYSETCATQCEYSDATTTYINSGDVLPSLLFSSANELLNGGVQGDTCTNSTSPAISCLDGIFFDSFNSEVTGGVYLNCTKQPGTSCTSDRHWGRSQIDVTH